MRFYFEHPICPPKDCNAEKVSETNLFKEIASKLISQNIALTAIKPDLDIGPRET